MNPQILTASEQVLAAAANSVYQGLLLALAVGLALKCFGRSNAATRHGLWLGTLLLLAGLLPAHLWLDGRSPARVAAPESATPPPAAGTAGLPVSVHPFGEEEWPDGGLVWLETPREVVAEVGLPQAADLAAGAGVRTPVGAPELAMLSLSGEPPPTADPSGPAVAAAPVPADGPGSTLVSLLRGARPLLEPLSWNPVSAFGLPRLLSVFLVGALALVAAFRLARLAWRLGELRRLKAASTCAGPDLERRFRILRAEMGVTREVGLRISPACRTPAVLGFRRPVILMPREEGQGGGEEETTQILRHELAHVSRRDDWTNLLQHAILALFYFQPAVWWISRRLSLEREIACDDHVLNQGGGPRAYALLLANLAGRWRRRPPVLAPGVSANQSQLEQRINMILNTRRNTSPRPARATLGVIASGAVLLAALTLYSAPRLVLAGTPDQAPAPPPPPAPPAVEPAEPSVDLAAPDAEPEAEDVVVPDAEDDYSAPRLKDTPSIAGVPADVTAPPAPPAPPEPPEPMALPAPPAPAAPPEVAVTARPGKLYVTGSRRPDDLERRLERLERQVRALLDQKKAGGGFGGGGFGTADVFNGKPVPETAWAWNGAGGISKAEAARAAEEFKRASRDFDRAMKEKMELETTSRADMLKVQLDALVNARANLQQQVERLDHQIQQLKVDREKRDAEKRETRTLRRGQPEKSDEGYSAPEAGAQNN